MFKKMFMVGISIFVVLTLGACGNADFSAEGNADVDPLLENKTEPVSKTTNGESGERNSEKTDDDSESAVLIAYFSWSGNTRQRGQWERVQELRTNKRRPTKTGKTSIFFRPCLLC